MKQPLDEDAAVSSPLPPADRGPAASSSPEAGPPAGPAAGTTVRDEVAASRTDAPAAGAADSPGAVGPAPTPGSPPVHDVAEPASAQVGDGSADQGRPGDQGTDDTARLEPNGTVRASAPPVPSPGGARPAPSYRDASVAPPQPLPLSPARSSGRHAARTDPGEQGHDRRITDHMPDRPDEGPRSPITTATPSPGAAGPAVTGRPDGAPESTGAPGDDGTSRAGRHDAAAGAADTAEHAAAGRPPLGPAAAATAALPVVASAPGDADDATAVQPAVRDDDTAVRASADDDATAVHPPVDDVTAEQPPVLERPPGRGEAAGDGPGGPGGPGDSGGGGGGGRPGDPAPESGGAGRPRWRRPALLVPLGTLLALGVLYGGDLAVAGSDVPRNTVVAGVPIGGMSAEEAAGTLREDLAPRVDADHVLVADDVRGVLSPATAGIGLDVEATVAAADGQPLNPWTRLVSFFSERDVAPVITGEETALTAQVDQLAGTVDRPPVDATIVVEGETPRVVPPVDGRSLDREGAAAAITAALASGGDPATPIELPVQVSEVRVDAAAAQRTLDETVTPALSAPVTVNGSDASTVEVPVEAIAASLTFTPQDDGTLAVALDPAALQTALGDRLEVFGSPAEDARFEVSGDSITVVPSVDGTGLDPAVLSESLLPALTQPAPREVAATLGPVPADFTTEEAQALGITEKISSFSTNFTNTASGTNIRVVAAEVDGAVVEPGETFSLNGFTGPRGTAEGYVSAGVINNGEFTTAVGGGISQFATTMFNAVFFAGLEDVFHKPHSYYISRYPAGREATVYYDSIDLQWRNDSPTGVYVQATWVPGTITVTFWGTKRFDVESESSSRFNVRGPVVQEKPDDGDCSPQSGSTGFDIVVTRVFKDPGTGAELRREDFTTRYAAEPVIRCVPAPAGPGAVPPGSPTG